MKHRGIESPTSTNGLHTRLPTPVQCAWKSRTQIVSSEIVNETSTPLANVNRSARAPALASPARDANRRALVAKEGPIQKTRDPGSGPRERETGAIRNCKTKIASSKGFDKKETRRPQSPHLSPNGKSSIVTSLLLGVACKRPCRLMQTGLVLLPANASKETKELELGTRQEVDRQGQIRDRQLPSPRLQQQQRDPGASWVADERGA